MIFVFMLLLRSLFRPFSLNLSAYGSRQSTSTRFFKQVFWLFLGTRAASVKFTVYLHLHGLKSLFGLNLESLSVESPELV